MASKVRIGVIGSGDVGQRLAAALAAKGHDVMMGTRDPNRTDLLEWMKAEGKGVTLATNAEAAKAGEMLIVATGWEGTENALKLAGIDNFAGKVVIDVTNPLQHPDAGGMPTLAIGHTDSAGEQVQRWLPRARVVKALNIVSNYTMVNPVVAGDAPTMFVAGNDAKAKEVTTNLLKHLGWKDVVDLGGIEGARLLEPLAMLWIVHGFRTNTWTHAFKLLR